MSKNRDALIRDNGLNIKLLIDNKVKINVAPEEDLIDVVERRTIDARGRYIVEEISIILVCEASWHADEIAFIEAFETRVHDELRGYRVQLSGPERTWAVLMGEELSSYNGIEYVTVGFVDDEGDVLQNLRFILVKEPAEMARLRKLLLRFYELA